MASLKFEDLSPMQKRAVRIARLERLANDLIEHLDYIGWGDSWEREGAKDLRERAKRFTKHIQARKDQYISKPRRQK